MKVVNGYVGVRIERGRPKCTDGDDVYYVQCQRQKDLNWETVMQANGVTPADNERCLEYIKQNYAALEWAYVGGYGREIARLD